MTKPNSFNYYFHWIGLSMVAFCMLAMGCNNTKNKTVQTRLPDTSKMDSVAKIQQNEHNSPTQIDKPDTIRNKQATQMNEDAFQKASVNLQDSSLVVYGNIREDYRIFGYEQPDTNSRKLIFFSVFTTDVKGNPYHCPYGAYYATSDMINSEIKYLSSTGNFIKANFIKNKKVLTPIYMLKDWVKFEGQN
ncbi:hypothetical protein G6M26_05760 [Agrobacterium tumefaciens]|nr:hypothetical protein [Agrobacterium tumefaciens]NTE18021.1 hypothetical protein [Agrobacterium tumefaciens]